MLAVLLMLLLVRMLCVVVVDVGVSGCCGYADDVVVVLSYDVDVVG